MVCASHHSHHGFTRWLSMAVASFLCGLSSASIGAMDPIAALQQELGAIFKTHSDLTTYTTLSSEDPHAIIERKFLWARPPDVLPLPLSISLRQIRSYAAPIRQAHAASVKIITPYWHGAGVVISAEGDILTSYHLVAGAPIVTVQTLDHLNKVCIRRTGLRRSHGPVEIGPRLCVCQLN